MFCWRNGLRAQVCNSDVKSCPVTCPAGTESRQWCSCKGVSGTFSVPAALFLEETRYTLYRTLGGPRRWSVRARRISPLTGVRTLDRPASSESLYRLSYCRHDWMDELPSLASGLNGQQNCRLCHGTSLIYATAYLSSKTEWCWQRLFKARRRGFSLHICSGYCNRMLITSHTTHTPCLSKRFTVDHCVYLVNVEISWMIMICWISFVNCLFDISSYRTENISITNTSKCELLYMHLYLRVKCLVFIRF